MKPDVEKIIITNLPYLLFVWLFGKVGEAWRLAAGADASQKMLHFMDSLAAAFANGLPSFHPFDLCIGIVGAALVRLAVYMKGKNAKKYRHGMEYGSARFGNAKDIAPYIDPVFENNILLTQTERLTMNGRPKDPKTARNKNVLVIGGSGSGKTRFFVKPNLMQMHSSYCITDPKGTVNIKITRDADNKVTSVAYMTEAEVTELLEDMSDDDDDWQESVGGKVWHPQVVPVNYETMADGEIVWLGEYTLSKGDRIWYDVSAETGNGLQVGFAKPGDSDLNTTYFSVANLRQEGETLKCTSSFTFGTPVKPGTYKLFLRATDGALGNVKGSISIGFIADAS